MTFSDFKGAVLETIMVVEVVHSGIGWMEPRDLSFDEAFAGVNRARKTGISSQHGAGANALFADAHVHYLPQSISPRLLNELLRTDVSPEMTQEIGEFLRGPVR
jgi:prepilin-type processing-associated H-X9-DG protein